MTDRELVAKKLALIETSVHELRTLARPEEIRRDVREERFVEYTLQIAIQSALDVAAHIASHDSLGSPLTNRALFELLGRYGWIPADLTPSLCAMAGFRNILVHGYGTVDLAIVEEILRDHLDDLLAFVNAVRTRLNA